MESRTPNPEAVDRPDRHHRVLILGGGSAGITVAARLRRADRDLDVAVVEPSSDHYYQPLWTLVGAGVIDKRITRRDEARYIPRGVSWIRDAVAEIDAPARTVRLVGGDTVGYDALVVALGIQLDWDRVAGLRETLGRNGVVSNYSYATADATWRALDAFDGGTAIFTNPAGQVKCGGAPQKIMYLADDLFRRRGIRDRSQVVGAFAGTKMLGVPEINATLERVVRERGVDMRFHHDLVAIDGPGGSATFEVRTDAGCERIDLPFDLIHVTPPQSAPDVLKRSALAVAEGPHQGFAEVDMHTLQSPTFPEVFALGDAAALPTAKTGAAVRKQAPVVVANLRALLRGEDPSASYDGYSSCPLITGYGRLVLAEFTYGNRYKPTFPVDQTKERLDMYLLKRYLLPQLYWHGMLRGLA